jgi:hypothetical protein
VLATWTGGWCAGMTNLIAGIPIFIAERNVMYRCVPCSHSNRHNHPVPHAESDLTIPEELPALTSALTHLCDPSGQLLSFVS